jgi:hypothetical protein
MTIPIRTVPGSRAAPVVAPAVAPARQNARPLPAVVRARMEATFGVDLSTVTVREDGEPAAEGVDALTRGEAISLRPGLADPHSSQGLQIIGHELAHVLQQRAGRVPGTGLTEEPELETEADEAGRRAARGAPVHLAAPATDADGAPAAGGTAAPAVAQPGRFDALRRTFGRGGGQAPPQVAPVPAPQPQLGPGGIDVQAVDEQRQDMHRLARQMQLQLTSSQDPGALYEQIKKVLRIASALETAGIRAGAAGAPPAPFPGGPAADAAVAPAPVAAAPPDDGPIYAMTPGDIPGQESPYAKTPGDIYESPYGKTPGDIPGQESPYGKTPGHIRGTVRTDAPTPYIPDYRRKRK